MSIDAPPHPDTSAEDPAPRGARGPVTFIVVAAMLVAAVGIIAFIVGGNGSSGTATPSWHGRSVDPALPRPSFTLTDTSGQPYDFAAETAGQLTFLYFGYTNCPDVCPITIANLSQSLGEVNGVAAKVVFVTTDPTRDTPERLRQWLDNFDGDFVGLTGTAAELEAAQKAAGVTVAIADAPDDKGNYTVGHSAAMHVYTGDDREHLNYPWSTTQSEWTDDIPRIAADPEWNAVDGIRVTGAYASPTSGDSGAIYVTIANGADDDAVTGASSPDAAGAALHVTTGDGATSGNDTRDDAMGGGTMSGTDELAVPGGATVQLEPGGDHIMLTGLDRTLDVGDTVTVTIRFRHAPPVTVEAPVISYEALASRTARSASGGTGGSP